MTKRRASFFALGALRGLGPQEVAHLLSMRWPLSGCLAGRISREPHRSRWLGLELSEEVADLVRQGASWTWKSTPPGPRRVGRHFVPSPDERKAVDTVLAEYRDLGACVETEETEWVSPIFGRPKPSGKWRLIADLSVLNRHIWVPHFKMESLASAVELAWKECWFCKLDLSNAYFHVGMRSSSLPYLGFTWGGKLYRWVALPFGLAVAPRLFSKLMKQGLKMARALGVPLVIYLDDVLVIGKNPEECRTYVIAVAAHLHRLGFTVNLEKSVLDPTQSIQFLGLELDSRTERVSVGKEKLDAVRKRARQLLTKQSLPTRELAKWIGTLVSLRPAISPALLHLRHLDLCKSRAVAASGWEGTASLTPQALDELRWWDRESPGVNGSSWSHPPPQWVLTTDAALEVGWGATLERHPGPTVEPGTHRDTLSTPILLVKQQLQQQQLQQQQRQTGTWPVDPPSRPRSPPSRSKGPAPPWAGNGPCNSSPLQLDGPPVLEARGLWTEAEKKAAVSVNRWELEALIRALRRFREHLAGSTVVWRSDNQVALYCVQKFRAKSTDLLGGMLELHQVVTDLGVWILPEYLPGELNSAADRLSRRIERQDWKLHPAIFARLCKIRWSPSIDAFASAKNRQTDRFWSWTFEEGTSGVDFFHQNLKGERLYGNPPFTLLTRVLRTLQAQRARMILIVPRWESAVWWPLMRAMLVSPPLPLPRDPDLFLPASTDNQCGVGVAKWDALAVEVSGNLAEVAEAREVYGPALMRDDPQLVEWWTRHRR